MKFAPSLVLFAVLIQMTYSKPVKSQKFDEDADSSVYIVGNIRNAAMSHHNSKSQAASDRNNSEWNNTELKSNSHPNTPSVQSDQNKDKEQAGLLIYAGGDAANLALAYSGSEAQAAENDQKSGYNTQNMGLSSGVDDEYDHAKAESV